MMSSMRMQKYTQLSTLVEMPHSHLVNCGDVQGMMRMFCWMEEQFGASEPKTWRCARVKEKDGWARVRFVNESDYMLWRLSWS
jgi:hypothetical protein